MEFSIGSQFSREFSWEDSCISNNLATELNKYFTNMHYGKQIIKTYTSFICVSAGFDPFFQVRKPKINKEYIALEYELKVNYDYFFNLTFDDKKNTVSKEFLEGTKAVFRSFKFKDFNVELFLNDLETFFETYRP